MKERTFAILLAAIVLFGVAWFNWPVTPEMTFDEYLDSLPENFELFLFPTYMIVDDMVAQYALYFTGSVPSDSLIAPSSMELRMRNQEQAKTSRRVSRLLKSYAGEVYQEQAPVILYSGINRIVGVDPETQLPIIETESTTQVVPGTWYYPEGREDIQFLILRCRGEYTLWKFHSFPTEDGVDDIVRETFPDALYRVSRFDTMG